jgi:hypothetical protein
MADMHFDWHLCGCWLSRYSDLMRGWCVFGIHGADECTGVPAQPTRFDTFLWKVSAWSMSISIVIAGGAGRRDIAI